MIALLSSFDPFGTSNLPAAGIWTEFAGVTIVADAGRSGWSGDNAALFDYGVGDYLSRDLSLTAVAGVYTATFGFAEQLLTLGGDTILASLWTTNSKFDLWAILTGNGVSLRLTQEAGGVPLGTIMETVAGVLPVTLGGAYIEVQIRLALADDSACLIRVSDQYGEMQALVQGPVLALLAGESPSKFRLGATTNTAVSSGYVDDVYLTDGVPTAIPLSWQGRLIYNDSFLGNTHITTFYPTADGTNLSTGNTPWVPSAGSTSFNLINEHPPDEDTTYLSADTSDQTTTCSYQSPYGRPFGRIGCEANAAIYGLQWDARARSAGSAGTIASIVRQIVGGTFATDLVEEGDPQVVDNETYLYYPDVLDRNPIDDEPWTFAVFFPTAVSAIGSTEFGVRLL